MTAAGRLIYFLNRFHSKDEIKVARIEAAKALTRPLATLSRSERDRVRSRRRANQDSALIWNWPKGVTP